MNNLKTKTREFKNKTYIFVKRHKKWITIITGVKLVIYAVTIYLVMHSHSHAANMNGLGNSKEPIEISSDSLDVLQEEGKAIFRGKVDAKQGNVNIHSDTMTVFYKNGGAGGSEQNKISKLIVEGSVLLNTPTETAKAKKGEYNVDKGLITLNNNVVLTRGKNVLTGDNLEYDVKTSKSRMVSSGIKSDGGSGGRVKGLFIPESGK